MGGNLSGVAWIGQINDLDQARVMRQECVVSVDLDIERVAEPVHVAHFHGGGARNVDDAQAFTPHAEEGILGAVGSRIAPEVSVTGVAGVQRPYERETLAGLRGQRDDGETDEQREANDGREAHMGEANE